MSGRVLVTGAAGFVGRKLCAYLAAQGFEVFGCDRVASNAPGEHLICDFTDGASIEDTIQSALPLEFIIHLAAIAFVPEAIQSPTQVVDVNLQGTIRLVEAMRAHAPQARLVFVGSSEVYGPPKFIPVTEDHPFGPTNPYAITKAAADQYCQFCSENEGLDIVRMRPFNHSGPGQSDRFVLSSFARQIAEIEKGDCEPLLQVGELGAARDFLHVDDVIRAYEAAMQRGRAGEAYNICSGNSYRIGRALETLVEMTKVDIQIEVDPERLRPIDVPELRGSHEKFSTDTGWTPTVPFQKLLADLLDYWRRAT